MPTKHSAWQHSEASLQAPYSLVMSILDGRQVANGVPHGDSAQGRTLFK